MRYDITSIKAGLTLITERSIRYVPLLAKLDSHCGDGDMGVSIYMGATAVKNEVITYQGNDVGELFVRSGMSLNRSAPSTIGTLLSSCLLMLGKKFKGCHVILESEIIQIPTYCADAIMLRGNAQIGDKTILDALIPLSEAIIETYNECGDMEEALRRGAHAAKLGAHNTRGMLAKIGRAKWIADRSKEYPDAGAVYCSIVMDGFVDRNKPEGYILPDYEAMYAKREKK